MIKKTYNFSVTANSEAECLQKMQSATTIVSKLSHADLLLLAKAINEKPGLIDMARPFLT